MSAVYTHPFFLILTLLLIDRSVTDRTLPDWYHVTPEVMNWDKDTLFDLEKSIYFSMLNNYDSFVYVKSRYKRHAAFSMGTYAFTIRKIYAQQMHLIRRCNLFKGKLSRAELIKNATSCQRMHYAMHIATDIVKTLFQNYTKYDPDDVEDNKLNIEINDTLKDNSIKDTKKPEQPDATREGDPGDNERRRRFAQKSRIPRAHRPRNVRKSLRFLSMADYTLRLQQLVKSIKPLNA
ncbi:uncharacterized protein LOC134804878 [Cydia splendana]|uniref:uncharacterized protein LOC134804878 n=1 Tax=Cydia splendana TaxID=1100963 RepID=UPI0028F49310